MFSLFMKNLRSQGRRSRQSKRQRPKARSSLSLARFQPQFERLEDRALLTVSIINAGGLGYAGNGSGGPPDETGAAGPNSYIETSNGTLSIFNKATGATLVPSVNPDTFFFTTGGLTQIAPDSQRIADVTMVYDDLMGGTGRFIIGNIDILGNRTGPGGMPVPVNISQFVFAVSESNNPTSFTAADWNFYQITTTRGAAGNTRWTDYPGNPGFNADAFVVTFNMAQGGSLTGDAQILSINSNDLANGVAQGSLNFFQNDIAGSNNFRPATMHDSVAGDPMWFVQDANDGNNINVRRMNNVLSNSATFTTTTLALPVANRFPAGGMNNPLNPDSTPMNDVPRRILKAAQENNTLVATQTVPVGTFSIASATVALNNMGMPVGGSGYTVGDTLTLVGGTFTTAATLRVATLGAGGSVSTVTVLNPGTYSSGGLTGAVTGGTGTGAMFNVNVRGELDVQWYAINVSGTPAFQQVGGVANVGRIGFGPNTYAFEPAIDINDDGQIGLGFMQSDTLGGAANAATGGFPSTFVTARKPTDPAGTMQPVILVSAGTGTSGIGSGGTRIGDFSGMNVDPVNGTFWHVNQFGRGGGGPTDIANFTPEDRPTVTPPSDQIAFEGTAKSFNLGSFADPDGSPWSVDVNWGDGSPHTVYNVSAVGSLGTQLHNYVDDDPFTGTPFDNFNVVVTVTDFTGLSAAATFRVTVDNVAPSIGAIALSASSIIESQSVMVSGSFTDPALGVATETFTGTSLWSDGVVTPVIVDSALGTFSTTRTFLDDDPVTGTPADDFTVNITIRDDDTGTDIELSPTLTVNNVNPVIVDFVSDATFSDKGKEGEPVNILANFTDIGILDTHTAVVDWGDASALEMVTVNQGAGFGTVTGSHPYAAGGIYTIALTLTDDDTGTAQAMTIAVITGVGLNNGILYAIGSAENDEVSINQTGGGVMKVRATFIPEDFRSFSAAAVDQIISYLCEGDDQLSISSSVTTPAIIHGDGGNDHLNAGGGPTVLLGGEGDDVLVGQSGRNIMIGGLGMDKLTGGKKDDVLIGGSTTSDNDDDALLAAILAWNAVDNYDNRAAAVDALLVVTDDSNVDTLTGSAGLDLFYDGLGDTLNDRKMLEFVF